MKRLMAAEMIAVGEESRNFFFQAEDGIRDHCVTGVQTCALPISTPPDPPEKGQGRGDRRGTGRDQIGRASCRERVEISVVVGRRKKKTSADSVLRCDVQSVWETVRWSARRCIATHTRRPSHTPTP